VHAASDAARCSIAQGIAADSPLQSPPWEKDADLITVKLFLSKEKLRGSGPRNRWHQNDDGGRNGSFQDQLQANATTNFWPSSPLIVFGSEDIQPASVLAPQEFRS
jgi:hypothetical protein